MDAVLGRIDDLFSMVLSGRVDQAQLEVMRTEIESLVPHSDDYGFELAVQAQSGALCALNAIDALDGQQEAVVDASNVIVDAVDNFAHLMAKELGESDDTSERSLLLDREIQKQVDDVSFLRSERADQPNLLREWRLLNRQFSVPIAVLIGVHRVD